MSVVLGCLLYPLGEWRLLYLSFERPLSLLRLLSSRLVGGDGERRLLGDGERRLEEPDLALLGDEGERLL